MRKPPVGRAELHRGQSGENAESETVVFAEVQAQDSGEGRATAGDGASGAGAARLGPLPHLP